ncbi:MAG: sulfotransferase domain-containing protein [Gemmataceae bacterium]
MKVQLFTYPRPKVIVASHERSGTHFLMNSIARCFGYCALPWVNFDSQSLASNFYSPEALKEFFSQFRGKHVANIVKSHHPFPFLEPVMDQLVPEFHIFYVYRDPRDVMVSLWKFLKQLSWREGPTPETVQEFIRVQPEGHMMRYQRRQEPSMIHRWRTHVDSWTLGVPERFQGNITFVRFADLLHRFEDVIRSISKVLGNPVSFERPVPQDNSILPAKGVVGAHREYFDAADLALFNDIAGHTMERLAFSTEAMPLAS